MPLIFAVLSWLVLKPTFFSRIEIREGKIFIKNFFTKKEIPIRLVEEARAGEYLEVVLASGERYGCINFIPSLAGALAGFPTNRRCAETLNGYLREKKGRCLDEEYEESVRTLPHVNLVFLAVLSTVFLALSLLLF